MLLRAIGRNLKKSFSLKWSLAAYYRAQASVFRRKKIHFYTTCTLKERKKYNLADSFLGRYLYLEFEIFQNATHHLVNFSFHHKIEYFN